MIGSRYRFAIESWFIITCRRQDNHQSQRDQLRLMALFEIKKATRS